MVSEARGPKKAEYLTDYLIISLLDIKTGIHHQVIQIFLILLMLK
jgi:hypothetical protein